MATVSYDLAIWEGDRPTDDATARDEYRQLRARYMRSEPELPTPPIAAFIRALLDRYPEIGTEGGEDSPWAAGPLMRDTSGPFFYLPLVYSQCGEASAWVAQVAQEHGLVCYDLQIGKVRP